MNSRIIAANSLGALATSPAVAETTPIFGAECAGGVNRGGDTIDTDGQGDPRVNGHRVNLANSNRDEREGACHGANGICTIVSM